jgi:hypothetical protein
MKLFSAFIASISLSWLTESPPPYSSPTFIIPSGLDLPGRQVCRTRQRVLFALEFKGGHDVEIPSFSRSRVNALTMLRKILLWVSHSISEDEPASALTLEST